MRRYTLRLLLILGLLDSRCLGNSCDEVARKGCKMDARRTKVHDVVATDGAVVNDDI
jgi:hypothetical protein